MHRSRGAAPPLLSPTLRSLGPLLPFAFAAVAVPVLAAALPTALWGAHAYAFLPPSAWILGLALLASVPAAAAWAGRRTEPALGPPSERGAVVRWAVTAALLLGAAALLIVARARHALLGDGLVLLSGLNGEFRFHALEPLTMIVQNGLYRAFAAAAAPETSPEAIAWRAVAAGSIAAGTLFALTARALGRELVRSATAAGGTPAGSAWVAALLLSQGYVQVFFGYIENYAYVMVAVAWYLLAALAYLRGRLSSALPAMIALVVACCLHLSALALAPSAVVLVLHGMRSSERRGALPADLVSLVLIVAAFAALLTSGGGRFVGVTVADTVRQLGEQHWRWRSYGFSWLHARDLLNELWLIGPCGAPLALAFLWRRPRGGRATAARSFLLVALLPTLLVLWIADDSNLGYARNWDLLALSGLILAVAGAWFVVERFAEPAARVRALVLVVALSLVHTGAWVALNASASRSLARFATLPLGLGRTESTLGAWHLKHGNLAEAERWLLRSRGANPHNARAHFYLGVLYLRTQRAPEAVAAFAAAQRLRPDRGDFRLALVDALARSERWAEAEQGLERLLAETPAADALWAARAMFLARRERWDEALESAERSALLWEGHPPYRELRDAIRRRTAFPELADRFWGQVSEVPWPTAPRISNGHWIRRHGSPRREPMM